MKILVVAAMDREIEVIQKELSKSNNYYEKDYEGYKFYFGNIASKEVILVKSGVGRVNSALLIAIAKIYIEFDFIINIGISGGVMGLHIGDIVIGEKTVYGDVDLSVFEDKYVYGQMSGCPRYYDGYDKIINFLKNDELGKDVKYGTICSCEKFTTDKVDSDKLINDHFSDLNVLSFDMESACYAQACHKFNIPFVAIRFISDVIGSDGQIENYVITEDDTARDKRTNEFVIKVIEKL